MSGPWPSCRGGADRPHEGSSTRTGLRTHLVFAPDGRLAERQLVEMPSGKIRMRESTGRTEQWNSSPMGKEKTQAGRPRHNGRSNSRRAAHRS